MASGSSGRWRGEVRASSGGRPEHLVGAGNRTSVEISTEGFNSGNWLF